MKKKKASSKKKPRGRRKETIFVSIASYRDRELVPTLDNMLSESANPNNIKICVCWQHDDDEDISKYQDDPRFLIIDVPYKEARGVCWARNLIQKQYSGETYYLQLDSHHRFAKNWDTTLKNKIKKLKKDGYSKPIISTYLPSYEPDRDPESRLKENWNLSFDRFMPEGAVFLRPNGMPDGSEGKMIRGRFLSGHMVFSDGHFCENVLYDPQLYFHGEETSLGVRAFTHGYDMFQLDEQVVWHYYHRDDGSKRHWDDHSNWDDVNKYSFKRFKKLLNVDGVGDDEVRWGPYGLGKERTLDEYERYAGIRFETRRAHKETKKFLEPPVSQEDFDDSLEVGFKYCIDLHKNDITESDCDWMAVAFTDDSGEEIARIDADQNEIVNLLNEASNGDGWLRIWREFESSTVPKTWVVWPHSKSKGFLQRIERDIPRV